jgi:DNA repair protein RadD
MPGKNRAPVAGRGGGLSHAALALDSSATRWRQAAPCLRQAEVSPPAKGGATGSELRDYQIDVIDRLRAAIRQQRRVLLVAPTGSGKTVIASAVVHAAVAKGSRVLFLAHRRELVRQAHAKLYDYGIDAGIIQAGFEPRLEQAVQVASISTLWARAYRGSRMDQPPADLVIVDEAHRIRARTYAEIVDSYSDAVILGLTATPCRSDGRGLGNAFDAMVECPPVQALIDQDYLVPTKVYAPSQPDLTGVRVERGDYVESQLAERVNTDQLVGDIVTHWHKLAENRKTVVFATGVAHSIHIRDEFRRSGVLAEHIDGNTPADERDAILGQLSRGEIDVVCNCMVLTEGWDQPDVACIVLARPTKHMGLYRQMVGRVLRPAPGKDHALVLDHAGAVFQHGFVEEPVIWTLDQDRRAENPEQKARSEHQKPALTTCPECHAIRTSGQPCPACGWRPQPKPRHVDVIDGDLAHVERNGKTTVTHQDKRAFLAELIWAVREKGKNPGWARHLFKQKYGHWPAGSAPTPRPASPATYAWIRSRQIAYAKARTR